MTSRTRRAVWTMEVVHSGALALLVCSSRAYAIDERPYPVIEAVHDAWSRGILMSVEDVLHPPGPPVSVPTSGVPDVAHAVASAASEGVPSLAYEVRTTAGRPVIVAARARPSDVPTSLLLHTPVDLGGGTAPLGAALEALSTELQRTSGTVVLLSTLGVDGQVLLRSVDLPAGQRAAREVLTFLLDDAGLTNGVWSAAPLPPRVGSGSRQGPWVVAVARAGSSTVPAETGRVLFPAGTTLLHDAADELGNLTTEEVDSESVNRKGMESENESE